MLSIKIMHIKHPWQGKIDTQLVPYFNRESKRYVEV